MADAKVLPIVAPPSEPRKPDTLVDMWKIARTQLGEDVTYWAFQHAKAVGRRERADRELKRVEGELSSLQYRAATLTSDAAIQLLMNNAPEVHEFHRLDTALADAIEIVTATASVLEILQRKAKP